MLVNGTGSLPTQMAIKAVGTDCGVASTAKKQSAVALASQVVNDELQQAFAQAPAFLLREQGKNHNLTSLGGATAVADDLPVSTGNPAFSRVSPRIRTHSGVSATTARSTWKWTGETNMQVMG